MRGSVQAPARALRYRVALGCERERPWVAASKPLRGHCDTRSCYARSNSFVTSQRPSPCAGIAITCPARGRAAGTREVAASKPLRGHCDLTALGFFPLFSTSRSVQAPARALRSIAPRFHCHHIRCRSVQAPARALRFEGALWFVPSQSQSQRPSPCAGIAIGISAEPIIPKPCGLLRERSRNRPSASSLWPCAPPTRRLLRA